MKWFSVRGHKHSESPHGVIKGHAYAYKDQAEEPTTIGPSIIKDGPQRKHAWLRSTSEVHQGRHLFTSFPRNSPPSLDFISTPVRPFRQFGKPTMHASRVKNAGVLRVRSTFASKEARQHLQIRIPSLFFFIFTRFPRWLAVRCRSEQRNPVGASFATAAFGDTAGFCIFFFVRSITFLLAKDVWRRSVENFNPYLCRVHALTTLWGVAGEARTCIDMAYRSMRFLHWMTEWGLNGAAVLISV